MVYGSDSCSKNDNSGCYTCRAGCGACCIALSISSPIPGMPEGKPAGIRCVQLSSENLCLLFGKPERPEVCRKLRPNPEMCGTSFKEAYAYLEELEKATVPLGEDTRKSMDEPEAQYRHITVSPGSPSVGEES